MSDLISRSELISHIENEHRAWGEDYDIEQVLGDIEDFPTAYDVGKVVDELENHKDTTDLTTVDKEMVVGFTTYQGAFNDAIEQAIEIVKQGCISDDVCEWKYDREIMCNAEFKVGCNPNALKRGIVPNNFAYHDFKHCPYCGKKIKVVE